MFFDNQGIKRGLACRTGLPESDRRRVGMITAWGELPNGYKLRRGPEAPLRSKPDKGLCD